MVLLCYVLVVSFGLLLCFDLFKCLYEKLFVWFGLLCIVRGVIL